MAITLTPYDKHWPKRFTSQGDMLRRALKKALMIEHIGSTAVPGLAAKPVIDILVAVDDVLDGEIQPAMRRQGYELTVDEPDHRMYCTKARDVHVHFWPADSFEIKRHIAFRDHLRANEADRILYEAVKFELAQREWSDTNDYAQAKTPIISAILSRAT